MKKCDPPILCMFVVRNDISILMAAVVRCLCRSMSPLVGVWKLRRFSSATNVLITFSWWSSRFKRGLRTRGPVGSPQAPGCCYTSTSFFICFHFWWGLTIPCTMLRVLHWIILLVIWFSISLSPVFLHLRFTSLFSISPPSLTFFQRFRSLLPLFPFKSLSCLGPLSLRWIHAGDWGPVCAPHAPWFL